MPCQDCEELGKDYLVGLSLLTESASLLRRYEKNHRDKANGPYPPGMSKATINLKVADTLAKAEVNAELARRIEAYLDPVTDHLMVTLHERPSILSTIWNTLTKLFQRKENTSHQGNTSYQDRFFDDFGVESDDDDEYTVRWATGHWLTVFRTGKMIVGKSPRDPSLIAGSITIERLLEDIQPTPIKGPIGIRINGKSASVEDIIAVGRAMDVEDGGYPPPPPGYPNHHLL